MKLIKISKLMAVRKGIICCGSVFNNCPVVFCDNCSLFTVCEAKYYLTKALNPIRL